jgi:hypothetical protein
MAACKPGGDEETKQISEPLSKAEKFLQKLNAFLASETAKKVSTKAR